MTHTLHRRGSEDGLSNDYVLLCMAAKGINEEGSVERIREFLRIVMEHNPMNIGDMRTGNRYNAGIHDILENITSTSIVHGVFTDRDAVSNVLRDLSEADLGLSVVVSGTFGCVKEICKAAGLTPHSVDYSVGIWGKKEKLPEDQVLEVTTMCGHAMAAPNLVKSLVNDIGRGHISAEDAAEKLAVLCECGIFNPKRAADLLRKMASKPAPGSKIS